MELTYTSYLKLDRLLDLQEPKSDPVEHDELLFIVIHQVYELWFKQVLWELDGIKRQFGQGDLFSAIASFKRLRTIIKTLVGQLDILETMSPVSFLAFRDRLETASGFQSAQFRELEFVLGFKRPEILRGFTADDELPYDEKAFDKRLRKPEDAAGLLGRFRARLAESNSFDPETLDKLMHAFTEAEGIKIGRIIHAVRVAVTGTAVGFGMFDTLSILGRERCLARIDRALGEI